MLLFSKKKVWTCIKFSCPFLCGFAPEEPPTFIHKIDTKLSTVGVVGERLDVCKIHDRHIELIKTIKKLHGDSDEHFPMIFLQNPNQVIFLRNPSPTGIKPFPIIFLQNPVFQTVSNWLIAHVHGQYDSHGPRTKTDPSIILAI